MRGKLIAAKDGVLSGAIFDLDSDSRDLTIEAFAGGILLGSSRCNGVGDKGMNNAGSFALELEGVPPELEPPFEIHAQIAGSLTKLEGVIPIQTPEQQQAALQRYAGLVVGVADGGIEGWALDKLHPGTAVDVSLEVGGRVVATEKADRTLPASEEGGAGHGFRIVLPATVFDGKLHTLRVLIGRDAYELVGSPFPVVLLAVTSVLERVAKLERSNADLRRRLDRQVAELADRIYVSLGADLTRRMDAIALLQRDSFEYELASLRRHLGVPSRSAREAPPSPSSVEVIFDDNLMGYGWHGTERSDNMVAFRWMSEAGTAILDFTSRQAASLVIEGLLVLDEIHLTTLQVEVNACPVVGKAERTEGGWRFVGEVPVHAFLRTPYTVLTIRTDFAREPSEQDLRKISIAVHSVRLSSNISQNAEKLK